MSVSAAGSMNDDDTMNDQNPHPTQNRENPRTSEKPVRLRLRAQRLGSAVRAAPVASSGAQPFSRARGFTEKS
jgi:hypothetical protein